MILDIETAGLVQDEPAGALSPWAGRVTWACLHDGRDLVLSVGGGPEVDLLEALDEALARHRGPVVAHNGHGFDFPFLRLRAMACGLSGLARRLHQDKPWSGRLVDTATMVPMPHGRVAKGWYSSAERLAALVGVEVRPTRPASEMHAAWWAGEHDDIRLHCEEDVRVLAALWPVLQAATST
jgi:DNA polymerase elongation subunit (family B)